MDVDWEKIKYKFLDHINESKVKNFYDFYRNILII